MHASVAARLARLAPDQRAAATAPPGPVLCVAPAGSGKTTVLVARIAWLVDQGAAPSQIVAVTFNRRAAVELRERVDPALESLGVGPRGVRVATFHALGLEILRDAGVSAVERLAERDAVLRELYPGASAADRRVLDDAFTRLKLDAFVSAADVESDPDPGPVGLAFLSYERALRGADQVDFDDLVALAVRRLEADPPRLARWRERTNHLLVDEAQDLDRTQLRLACLLAAPANRIFLVGDDDQSIYGWRLADVRRILGLTELLPGLRRFDLETNYRCPAVVVERADRLIRVNVERFAKHIRPRADAPGVIALAADAGEDDERAERVLASWPTKAATFAFLARTNRNLHPAAVAAVRRGVPLRAAGLTLIAESPHLEVLLEAAAAHGEGDGEGDGDGVGNGVGDGVGGPRAAFLPALAHALGLTDDRELPFEDADGAPSGAAVAAALLGWAAGFPTFAALRSAVEAFREALARLRRDDASLDLATAHATKGLEFDHVAVVDMDDGRFPSGRALAEADDPFRAMEEERRLAYVAWTRARRTLTLVFDPGAPSPFLLDAFDPSELTVMPPIERPR